jgi:ATP-dependent Clp protease ATP-binding subunit ClpA
MTTNIGSKIIQEAEDLESPDFVQKMDEALMKFFRPELLNRLDAKIMFHKLDRTHLAQILKIKVNQLKKKLAERQLSLNISQEALDLICERGYDPANGARPIERAIKSTLKDRLTNLLVSNKIKAGDTVEVTVKDGEISL